jgi:hypothetical protein
VPAHPPSPVFLRPHHSPHHSSHQTLFVAAATNNVWWPLRAANTRSEFANPGTPALQHPDQRADPGARPELPEQGPGTPASHRQGRAKPWHIGPVKALCVALVFPIGYGLWHFAKTRKAELLLRPRTGIRPAHRRSHHLPLERRRHRETERRHPLRPQGSLHPAHPRHRHHRLPLTPTTRCCASSSTTIRSSTSRKSNARSNKTAARTLTARSSSRPRCCSPPRFSSAPP